MNPPDTEDIRSEYDFSNGIRGKHIERLAEGSNGHAGKDVAEFFPDSESVNEALRALAAIIRSQQTKHPGAGIGLSGNNPVRS